MGAEGARIYYISLSLRPKDGASLCVGIFNNPSYTIDFLNQSSFVILWFFYLLKFVR